MTSTINSNSGTRLPFCELHVHIEGTLEPATTMALAKTNGLTLPYDSEADLRAAYQFADLQSFLNLYYDNMQVLLGEDDFFEMGAAYLRRAHAGGVAHAEMFVDPQAHSKRGVPESSFSPACTEPLLRSATKLGSPHRSSCASCEMTRSMRPQGC